MPADPCATQTFDGIPLRETRGAPIPPASLTAFSCFAPGMGHSRQTDPDPYHWDNNTRTDVCLFQYTIDGEGRFCQGGREHRLEPGTAFLVPFPSDTQYWLPEGGEWEFAWATLGGDCVQHHVRALAAGNRFLLRLPPQSPVLEAFRELLSAHLVEPKADCFVTAALVYRLLMELHRHAAPAHAALLPEPVRRAQQYFDSRYHEIRTDVAGAAQAAGYSRYHFSRLFRRHTGTTPHEYLTRVRLRHAQALLEETDLPIQQVGQMAGFASHTHFCSTFRRRAGRTPGSLRRQRERFGSG
jgi:AraC-like DNA-binding protein